MAGEDKNPPPPPPPPPQQPGQVKLAAFWPQVPALWFAQAECTFAVKRVVAQFDRYCHVVTALPHESIRLVANIVEGEPSDTPYDDIKKWLVASHQLSDFQKAERLFQMPALGGRKPSELMAAMLETCPRGEEKTNLFACIFLQRLSCWPRPTTRTRRPWPPRWTSCGPSTTPPTAAAAWQLCRRYRTPTSWLPSPETGGVAAAPPAGSPVAVGEVAAARRPPGCRSRRLPRRLGWPPGSASSTGDMERPPLPVSSPAAGRETAVPGATKHGRPQRAPSPHRQLDRPPFSGRHRCLLQHFSSSFSGSWLWSSSQESQWGIHPLLGREEAGCGILRPPF
jgi:hypothetical protein